MSNFLYLFRGGQEDFDKLTDEKKQAHMELWQEWLDGLREQGRFVDGLPLSSEGKVVHKKGELITNGPFAEGAEVIGGYMILDAQDIDEALAVAKGNPHFIFGDGTMEVREIIADEIH